MKKLYFLIILSFVFSDCKKQSTTIEVSKNRPNKIIGSWKLVYGEVKENDSVQVKDLSETVFIKIINESHFAFFDQHKNQQDAFFSGAGTYTVEGDDYIETLDFVKYKDYRGHQFPFKVEFKGDSLIQSGHEKLEEAKLDRYIIEKYIRLE